MDTYPEEVQLIDNDAFLSYDDSIPYEEQAGLLDQPLQAGSTNGSTGRMGNKLYLLSDSTLLDIRSDKSGRGKSDERVLATQFFALQLLHSNGKRKREVSESREDTVDAWDIDMDGGRPNALLLEGVPISHLSTARIFAYATHFDAKPKGLEWINDTTCVLVFDSKSLAQDAFSLLKRKDADEPDYEGFVFTKTVPMTLWPPEESISKVFRKGEGVKGDIKMRIAKMSDVKKKGAKRESEFYRKHGEDAGKEKYGLGDAPPRLPADAFKDAISDTRKRRKRDDDDDDYRKRLDAELDDFLAEDFDKVDALEMEVAPRSKRSKRPQIQKSSLFDRISGDILSPREDTVVGSLESRIDLISPPLSKMRSDYIDDSRADSPPLLSRMRSDLIDEAPPSKMRSDYIANDGRSLLQRTSAIRALSPDHVVLPDGRWEHNERPVKPLPRRRSGRGGRSNKNQQDLDDELDAIQNRE